MKKLSIIVPVYNVEMYIETCIDSLLKQDLVDIEIIVVDDGCKDNSMKLVEKYNDERIKIVRRENGGLSAARNSGIKVASGKYIAFVDSDDFIDNDNAYREMYELAEKYDTDIVAGNGVYYYSEKKQKSMTRDATFLEHAVMDSEEFLFKSLGTRRVFAPVWMNIYRRSVLEKHNICFKEGILHEDELFTPTIMLKSSNIAIYNKDFYMYRQREGSIMNSGFNVKRGLDKLNIAIELDKLVNDIKSDKLRVRFSEYIVKFISYGIYSCRINDVSRQVKKVLIKNSDGIYLRFISSLININPKIFIIYKDTASILLVIKSKIMKGCTNVK